MKKKNTDSIVFINGEMPDWQKISVLLKKEYSMGNDAYIIAADGGIRNCRKAGIVPHAVIGDMDSIGKGEIEDIKESDSGIDILKFPREKDESDTQLALEHAISAVDGKIALVGALGGRLDHALANIYLLAAPGLMDREIHIFSSLSDIFVTNKSIKIKSRKGKRLTLLSLSSYTYFKATAGLKYRLVEERLLFSPVRGLSNEFISDEASLDIEEGILLIIKEI